jgi:hypothetical protein
MAAVLGVSTVLLVVGARRDPHLELIQLGVTAPLWALLVGQALGLRRLAPTRAFGTSAALASGAATAALATDLLSWLTRHGQLAPTAHLPRLAAIAALLAASLWMIAIASALASIAQRLAATCALPTRAARHQACALAGALRLTGFMMFMALAFGIAVDPAAGLAIAAAAALWHGANQLALARLLDHSRDLATATVIAPR